MDNKSIDYRDLKRSLRLTFFVPPITLFCVAFAIFTWVYHHEEMKYFHALQEQVLMNVDEELSECDTIGLENKLIPIYQSKNRSNIITDSTGVVLFGNAPKDYEPKSLVGITQADHLEFHNGVLCLNMITQCPKHKFYFQMIVPVDVKYRTLIMLFLILFVMLVLSISLSLFLYRRNLHNRVRNVVDSHQRMEQELKIAHNVQQHLVPESGEMKRIGGVQVYGYLKSAREVGGDLYDYVLRGDYLYFCVGDVSDKGTPAALLMAIVRSVFHQATGTEDMTIEKIVSMLNGMLCNDEKTDMFCTFFVGKLNLKTHKLKYVNCGHDAPLLNGAPLDVKPNCPLGVVDGYEYKLQSQQLDAGDTLLVYTDGVTEAKSAGQKFFGRMRLAEFVKTHLSEDVKSQGEQLMSTLEAFRGQEEQNDDITLLLLKI